MEEKVSKEHPLHGRVSYFSWHVNQFFTFGAAVTDSFNNRINTEYEIK